MRRRSRAGVATLEFAAAALLLLVLLQMLIEVGWQVATEIALEHGAHDALRFAITGNASAPGLANSPACRAGTIVWLVSRGAPTLLQANNLTVSSSYGNGSAVGSSQSGFGGTASQTVKYTLAYAQPYVTPFARMLTKAASYTHQLIVVAENEPYPQQPC